MFTHLLTDEQDPRTAEKVVGKLQDMLTQGEEILYLAVQKRPAVNLIPESIVVTDKRLVFCRPGNLGLTTSFEIFLWKDVKEVLFREEFFGARFTAVPMRGENFTVDYIPKVQARKLYQHCNQQLEKLKSKAAEPAPAPAALKDPEEKTWPLSPEPVPAPVVEVREDPAAPILPAHAPHADDEVTLKLKRLKTLFEKQLISQEEYESKKADILSQL
jgi:hypothetical protein